jgi:thiamine-phosphate pyrophosphorylase
MMTNRIRGLYAIADTHSLKTAHWINQVAQTLQNGASLLQYRAKDRDPEQKYWEAMDLLTLCRPLNTPLIINDDIALAKRTQADGVHLGKHDASIQEARELLGQDTIIGVSCYNEVARAVVAEQQGANYVAFGRFFPSMSKPDAVQADPAILREAKQRIRLPVVAIGGIDQGNAQSLIDAGADALAVINGIFNQADIAAASQAISQLFTPTKNP